MAFVGVGLDKGLSWEGFGFGVCFSSRVPWTWHLLGFLAIFPLSRCSHSDVVSRSGSLGSFFCWSWSLGGPLLLEQKLKAQLPQTDPTAQDKVHLYESDKTWAEPGKSFKRPGSTVFRRGFLVVGHANGPWRVWEMGDCYFLRLAFLRVAFLGWALWGSVWLEGLVQREQSGCSSWLGTWAATATSHSCWSRAQSC